MRAKSNVELAVYSLALLLGGIGVSVVCGLGLQFITLNVVLVTGTVFEKDLTWVHFFSLWFAMSVVCFVAYMFWFVREMKRIWGRSSGFTVSVENIKRHK